MIKLGIIGIGSMGCLFAARLNDRADVVMVGHWPEQLAALRQNGLTLLTPQGRSRHHVIRATDDLTTVGTVDAALILVKSHQTSRAAAQTSQILADDGIALTLQNGLGNGELLTAVLGSERVASGVTSEGANIVAPGWVQHAGTGHTHLAPSTKTQTSRSRLIQLAELFNDVGFPTSLIDNADTLLWGKLAVNAGINPLTALLQVPNGFLAENEGARRLMMQTAAEVALVAEMKGIPLPYPDAPQQALSVATETATNQSSMLQDILRGAPTEIEAICGAVVQNGRLLGIPTPLNQHLLTLVKRVEQGQNPHPLITPRSPFISIRHLLPDDS